MDSHRLIERSPLELDAEQVRLILNCAHIPFIAIDQEGLILEWNRQAEITFGWSAAEVLGISLAQTIIPPESREKHVAGLTRFKDGGGGALINRRVEVSALKKDGERLKVELAVFPVPKGDGCIYCAFLYDITARQADKAQLEKQSKQLVVTQTNLSAALTCMADGLYQTDTAGNLTYLNPVGERMLGYRFEDICGQNMHELIHSRFPQGKKRRIASCWLQAAVDDGSVCQEREDYFIHADGSFVPVLCSRAPLMVDEVCQGFVVCFHDIADRKARERLQSAEESVIEVLASAESVQSGIGKILETICDCCDWDVAGFWEVCFQDNFFKLTVTGYRQRSRAMTLAPAGQTLALKADAGIIGRVWSTQKAVWIPDMAQETTVLIRAAGVRNKFAGAFGFPVVLDGQVVAVIHFLSKKDRKPDDDTLHMFGRIGSHIGQFVARKRAEEQIRQKAEELARSNVELQQFACVVSHDLQQPLSVISSHSELLLECYSLQLDADGVDSLRYICESTDRMQQLIKDLLMYARTGMSGWRLHAVDTISLLKEVLSNLQLSIADNQAQILYESLPTVSGERTQLFQLFQNLIHNALKFRSKDPPRVHIRCRKEAGHHLFTIEDNGVGFDKRDSERIFTAFERTQDKSEYPGTGIGLSICKKIVESHGGKIWAESVPGEGSRFFFTLPAVSPAE